MVKLREQFAGLVLAAGLTAGAAAAGKNPTPQHVDEPVSRAASAPVVKKAKKQADPLKTFTVKHDRKVIKDFGNNDIDGCSTRAAEVRIKEPGICGALEREAKRRAVVPGPAPAKH